MPLDPSSPTFLAALDGFIADVETTMREKLKGIGDYKNLAEIESEIDRLTLRIEILGPDPEFQEVVKRLELKQQDVSRKRDQMKPFLLKLERELALYHAAKANGGVAPAADAAAPAGMAFAPAGPVAAAPAAAPVAASAPAPWAAAAPAPVAALAPVAPPRPPVVAAPVAAPVAPAPPTARPPAPTPMPRPAAPAPVAQAWPEPAAAAAPSGEIDMSLPPDDGSSESFLSPATDFITGPGLADGDIGDSAELMLEPANLVESGPPPAPPAPVSAGAQWPPPGQNIPDPFAAFQAAKPAAAAPANAPRPVAPTPAPARSPAAPVPPAGPARPPSGPPSQAGVRPPAPPPATGTPAPAGGPPKTPPWQKT